MLGQVSDVIGQALQLRPSAFRAVLGRDDVVVVVLVVAGVSVLVGQSVVLFLNRVRPLRFAGAVLMAAVALTVEIAVWTVGIWATAAFAGPEIGLADTFRVVALGHAPFLFSFLVLMPYFGRPIERLLDVWTLVAITVGLVVTTSLNVAVVLLAVAVGFAFRLVVNVLVGRWFGALDRWLWRTVTGTKVRVRAEDALSFVRQLSAQDAKRLLP